MITQGAIDAVADIPDGATALIGAGRVRRVICSFPRQHDSHQLDAKYGEIELELVPSPARSPPSAGPWTSPSEPRTRL